MILRDLELQLLKSLWENDEPAKSSELAEKFGVSKNTVRRRLSDLSTKTAREGFEIVSKPSAGFWIEVKDEEKAEQYFRQINLLMNSPIFGQNTDQEYSKHYIVRRLLAARSYVTLELLCDELYYSENSIKKLIKEADLWLQDFSLHIKLKRQYGYYVEGQEWRKRLALLYQDKIFVNLPAESQNREKEYRRMLMVDSRKQRKWYLYLRQYMSQSDRIAFSLIDFPIIAHYAELLVTRQAFQKQISFTAEQRQALAESGLMTEAAEILSNLSDEITVTDTETEAFAMLILALRSVTKQIQLTEAEKVRINREMQEIWALLDDRLSFAVCPDEAFLEQFSWRWYNVRNKLLFDVIPDKEYANPQQMSQFDFLTWDLCAEINQYILRKYQKTAKLLQLQPLLYDLQKLVDRQINEAFHYKMAVVSVYGASHANTLAEMIREQYGFYLKEISVLEYTQINDTMDETYDFLAADLRVHMRPSFVSCRVLGIAASDYSGEMLPELRAFFDEKKRKVYERLVTHMPLNTHRKSWEETLACIAEDLHPGANDGEVKEALLIHPCGWKEKSEDNMLFISCHTKKRNNFIKVYQCSETVNYENRKIQTIICYSYSGLDKELLYYVNMQMHSFIHQKRMM